MKPMGYSDSILEYRSKDNNNNWSSWQIIPCLSFLIKSLSVEHKQIFEQIVFTFVLGRFQALYANRAFTVTGQVLECNCCFQRRIFRQAFNFGKSLLGYYLLWHSITNFRRKQNAYYCYLEQANFGSRWYIINSLFQFNIRFSVLS